MYFRVLVAAGPLAQGGSNADTDRGESLYSAHNLFEFGDGRGDGPDRFRLAPVRFPRRLAMKTGLST